MHYRQYTRRTLAIAALFWAFCGPITPGCLAAQSAVPAKAMVVLVFDRHCKIWCTQVRPIMKELEREYSTRVEFEELDATGSQMSSAETKAKKLGVLNVFHDVADYVPAVLVYTARHKLVKELIGPKSKIDYKSNIDKALSLK
jgi:hypothetical protein